MPSPCPLPRTDADRYLADCSTSTTPRHPDCLTIHRKHPAQQPDRNIDTLHRYAVRSGGEGTVNELAHGHGLRRCRYRGQNKAHLQHVLTGIAVDIERLSGLPPAGEGPSPRQPTAFQSYLDQREIPRLKSWLTLGSWPLQFQDPRQSQADTRG